jgi:hypothetical protein
LDRRVIGELKVKTELLDQKEAQVIQDLLGRRGFREELVRKVRERLDPLDPLDQKVLKEIMGVLERLAPQESKENREYRDHYVQQVLPLGL